jgi:hypothetical protein
MPNGGTSTEQERKAILAAAKTAARRRASKMGKASRFLAGIEKKIGDEAVKNVIQSRQLAAEHGRYKFFAPATLTSRWIIDQELDKTWNQEMATDEKQKKEEVKSEETSKEEATKQEQQESTEQQAQETTLAEAEEEAVIQSQVMSEWARQNQLIANQQQERIRQQGLAQIKNQALAEQKKKLQKKVQKRVNSYLRRGVEELAQLIGNALDLGTSGISTLVTIFVYAFTLTDLNLQIIWGHYIKKGESFLFPALDDWDPLPVSVNLVPITVLHVLIFLIDILVIISLCVIFISSILVMIWPIALLGGVAAAGWAYINDFFF